ncbi:MAG: quinone-dependent dihydroorotate dehydrogenase [Bacteroidetes bacterium]|nr:quinone-dependent dihydroorotate dehydrogenase [Bacteroidota bacterium]
MYKIFIRPLLFLLKPEAIHKIVFICLKIGSKIPGVKCLLKAIFFVNNKQLERTVFGIKFKNPVGIAAGLDKNAEVFDMLGFMGFGFVEIGTVTPKAQKGNPKPRLFRLKKDLALINRMGFNNKGVDYAVEQLKKKKSDIIIGGNIGKNTLTPNNKAIDDYEYCYDALIDYVDYIVVNVSCPNVKDLRELQDKDSLLAIMKRLKDKNLKKSHNKPILLKISPDLTNAQLDDIIDIVNISKIDGIIATNTTTTRNSLNTSDKKINEIGEGGLSGKPLTDQSTEIIKYISKKSNNKIPIMAVGGVLTTKDAIEKLKAGASLVQIYTGFIYEGPMFTKQINKSILNETQL